jgi:hypothetical protein
MVSFALRVGYAAVRARRFDPIAGFLLAADRATVVIGLAFTLPVDIAKGLLGLLALGADAIVLAIVLGGIGYFLRHARTPLRTVDDCLD